MIDRREVPCGACRACCKNERVVLSPERGDAVADYRVVAVPGGWMLDHEENGDCVYLGESGCAIWDRAPWACREFDCRRWLQEVPEAMQDLLLPDDLDGDVARAARERLP